jgi:hypothetical protein
MLFFTYKFNTTLQYRLNGSDPFKTKNRRVSVLIRILSILSVYLSENISQLVILIQQPTQSVAGGGGGEGRIINRFFETGNNFVGFQMPY